MGKVLRRLLIALAAAVAVAVGLIGCDASAPTQPTTTPIPKATPIFASDAEALAAAKKAYAAYLKVADSILADGGSAPDRLKDVATGAALKTELDGYSITREREWRTVGETSFDHMRLQQYAKDSSRAMVITYLCVDVSKVDVLDAAGRSVVSSNRPERSQVQATFDRDGTSTSGLILSDKTEWGGTDTCAQ